MQKTVLITGASRGIGAACAALFAQNGYRVAINYCRSEEKANITMGASRPVFSVFLNLGMTAVVALGAWRVHTGHTAPGRIISFMSYFTIILNATLLLTRIFSVYSRGAASADRIAHVLEEKE